MPSECEQSRVFYVLAQLLSATAREFFAVGLFLVLSMRASGYDFFNSGFTLFLILIVVRLPFLNAYAFIFEATTIKSWDLKHVGIQKHKNSGYDIIHAIAILVSHILGGIAAATFKIYYEVAYGVENMGLHPTISPQLVVDTRILEKMGTDWSANERLGRLSPLDGVRVIHLPLNSTDAHGIDKTALTLWYFCEETVYVCLMCICFVHIWLGTGAVKEKDDDKADIPLNPFRPRYWKQLFQISILLTLIHMSLSRAFPTAHGSLHVTVFKMQYQAWKPEAREYDSDNNEATTRIVGALVGLFLAKLYNYTLLTTKRDKEDTWYFSLVWGMESPFEAEKKNRYSRVPRDADDQESDTFTTHMDEENSANKADFFKLRLPFTLDHSK